MSTKKNLSRDAVRLLRKVQKFLIAEPRRFDMKEGIMPSSEVRTVLQPPPCGTACCIAGAIYVIRKQITLNFSRVAFGEVWREAAEGVGVSERDLNRLCYVSHVHAGVRAGYDAWPEFYERMYLEAKTPLERACVGVARIEHFIATDGNE